ncbi:MAG: hypothetical protein ABI704_00520 [Kofleriaceae bacterium]
MTELRRVTFALLVFGGCSLKRWNDQRIKTVDVGPFEAAIPAGWRDVREYVDSQTHPKPPAGAHVITPEEAETSSGFQSTIMTMWIPTGNAAGMRCAEIGDMMMRPQSATLATTTETTLGADRLCTWTSVMQNAATTSWFRFHGDHVLYVQCTHADEGLSRVGEVGCARFWRSLASS